MSAGAARDFVVSGLAAGTACDLYLAARDGAGNESAAPLLLRFATLAAAEGPGDGVTSVPTLSEWGLVLLSLVLAGIGVRRTRVGTS